MLKLYLIQAGSPLTNNSSTSLELKGSGNIQSTLKTSTVSNDSTGHTGTSNFSNSNTSTLVVSNVDTDTSVVKYVDRSMLLVIIIFKVYSLKALK